MSRSLQRLVQEMHATPFASLSTHEQSIYTRIEDASTSLDVHIAGMVLLSPGCFKHSHANCNPPYEICTGKSSARAEVTEQQKELWKSSFEILLTMLQYVLRFYESHQVIKPFSDVKLANLSMCKSYCDTFSACSTVRHPFHIFSSSIVLAPISFHFRDGLAHAEGPSRVRGSIF